MIEQLRNCRLFSHLSYSDEAHRARRHLKVLATLQNKLKIFETTTIKLLKATLYHRFRKLFAVKERTSAYITTKTVHYESARAA